MLSWRCDVISKVSLEEHKEAPEAVLQLQTAVKVGRDDLEMLLYMPETAIPSSVDIDSRHP